MVGMVGDVAARSGELGARSVVEICPATADEIPLYPFLIEQKGEAGIGERRSARIWPSVVPHRAPVLPRGVRRKAKERGSYRSVGLSALTGYEAILDRLG